VSSYKEYFNIGLIKQIIFETNLILPSINYGEYIGGVFNPEGLIEIIDFYIEKLIKNKEDEYKDSQFNKQEHNYLSLIPDKFDFTLRDFTHSISNEQLSYRHKKFYSTMQPFLINTYIVNLERNKPIFKINSNVEIIWSETHSKLIKQCLKVNY